MASPIQRLLEAAKTGDPRILQQVLSVAGNALMGAGDAGEALVRGLFRAVGESQAPRGGARPAPAAYTQPRLHVPPDPATKRFQRQLPVPREMPAERVPRAAQYPQAREVVPVGPARPASQVPGQQSLPIGRDVRSTFGIELTPGTKMIPGGSSVIEARVAPDPAWGRMERLQQSDPETYRRIRGIAESTAANRGVNADEVMRAMLSPQGIDSNLLRNLAQPSEIIRSPGGAADVYYGQPGALVRSPGGTPVDQTIIPANISEILSRGGALTGAENISLPAARFAGELNPAVSRSVDTMMEGASRQPLPSVDPRVAAAIAAGVGAGGVIGLGDLAMRRAMQDQVSSQGSPALGQPTTANADLQLEAPSVTGAPGLVTGSQPIAGANPQNAIAGTANPSVQSGGTGAAMVAPRQALSFARGGVPSSPPAPITPGSPAAPVISTAGAGGVVQLSNDADSNYNQALQNAIQGIRTDLGPTWSTPAGYKAQAEYAAAKTPEIIAAMRATGAPASVGIESDAAFQTWAERNPALAYRAFLNSQRRGVSQQMPTAQGVEVGTSFGTNMTNNAVGQSQAAAASAMYGTQGASDMADALVPRSYEVMRKSPLF